MPADGMLERRCLAAVPAAPFRPYEYGAFASGAPAGPDCGLYAASRDADTVIRYMTANS